MTRWTPAVAGTECCSSPIGSRGVNQAVSEMHTGPQDKNKANGKWQPALLLLQLQNPYGNLAKMKLFSPTCLCNCGKLSLSAQKSKWTWQQICSLVTTGIRYIFSNFLQRPSYPDHLCNKKTMTTFHSILSKKNLHKNPAMLSSV